MKSEREGESKGGREREGEGGGERKREIVRARRWRGGGMGGTGTKKPV